MESILPAGLTITVIFLLQLSKNVIREIWDYQRAGDYVDKDTNTKSCFLDTISQYSGIAGVSTCCGSGSGSILPISFGIRSVIHQVA